MKVCDSKVIGFARFWLFFSSFRYHVRLVGDHFSYERNEYLGIS